MSRHCLQELYTEIVVGDRLIQTWVFYYPDGTYEQLTKRSQLL